MAAFKRLKGLFQRSGSRESKPESTLDKPGDVRGTVLDSRSPELTALEMAQQQDWEAKQLKVWEPGDVILDTYQVEDVMSGGMGYVYITTHRNWNVKVAIKSPNQMMLSNRAFYARVLREADSWIDLGLHPHIAYCYYVRKVDDIHHIFIEYVDGGNLRDWVSEARCYDLKVGLDLAIQFCHGMEYAQRHGMIAHRDIKPENILMTQDGLLKVTDFGIARFQKTEEEQQESSGSADMPDMQNGQLTMYGTRMGSYDYMSPEQYEDVHNVDIRADIYSFGVCLYEMFCGRKPYDTSSQIPASMIAQSDGKKPYEPNQLRGDIPSELAQLLKRCCALEREERYDSIEELRNELLQIYLRLFNEAPLHATVDETGLLADGLNNQAVSYLELGREAEAEKFLDEALSVEPTHPEATYNRCILLWRSGRMTYSALMLQLGEISGVRSDDWRVSYLKGLVHMERGDKEGAIRELVSARTASRGAAEVKSALSRAKHFVVTRHKRKFRGHTGSVESVSITPDGRHVLSGSEDKTLRLWELVTGKCIRTLEGHNDHVTSASISPDGRYAVSGSRDNTLRLWELSTGKCVRTFWGHADSVSSVCISPDGEYAVSGSGDMTLRLWELGTGRCIRTLEVGWIYSVCISTDGQYVVSGGDKTLRLWELDTGRCIRTFQGHTSSVTCVSISLDGRYVLSGSKDNTLRLWEFDTGKCIRTFGWLTWPVTCVSISPDGQYAVSGNGNSHLSWSSIHTIRLWELSTGRCIRTFQGHAGEVTSVFISPDGRYMISGSNGHSQYRIPGSRNMMPGSRNKILRLWELGELEGEAFVMTKPRSSREQENTASRFRALLDRAERLLESGASKEAASAVAKARRLPGYWESPELIHLWHQAGMRGIRSGLRPGWHVRTLEGRFPVSISPDGRHAVSGSEDKTLRLWELDTGRCIRTYEGHTGRITSVSISPDGRYAISGSGDHTLRLWKLSTGTCMRILEGHTGIVSSVSISPGGRYAVSGSWDKTLRLWKLNTGRCIRTYEGHTGEVYSVTISPDGQYAVSGSSDKTLRLWELGTGRCIRTYEGHTDGVTSVSISPEGRYAVSGSWDKTLRLWKLDTGRCIRTYEGHTGIVTSVSISPDGQYVLSGSGNMDNTLRLWKLGIGRFWKLGTGRCIRVFQGYIGSVYISPDGRYAISGSGDSTRYGSENKALCLWELDWEYEFPEPVDWNKGARPYLETFLTIHAPYAGSLPADRKPTEEEIRLALTRRGRPNWTEENFQGLIRQLQYAGYGWLRPEGVRKELEKMREWKDE